MSDHPSAPTTKLSPTASSFTPPNSNSHNGNHKNGTKKSSSIVNRISNGTPLMIPAQLIKSNDKSANNNSAAAHNNNNTNNRRKNRRKRGNHSGNKTEEGPPKEGGSGKQGECVASASDVSSVGNNSMGGGGKDGAANHSNGGRNGNRARIRKKRNPKQTDAANGNNTDSQPRPSSASASLEDQKPSAAAAPKASQKKKKRKKKKKDPSLFAWRKHIPSGTVDPISLDPLDKLPYPPFALRISPPYHPVPEWPPPVESSGSIVPSSRSGDNGGGDDDDGKRLRQKKLLEEQWGKQLFHQDVDNKAKHTTTLTPETQTPNNDTAEEEEEQHYHLFDGRVLACYLVSQLQFIDPLNRRDLTRDELTQLDAYLRRHNLHNTSYNHSNNDGSSNNKKGRQKNRTAKTSTSTIQVLEAYDARGVTISSAGVNGQSARGLADILQQEARVLLNSIFEGNLIGNNHNNTNTNNSNGNRNNHNTNDGGNELARQYAQSQAHTNQPTSNNNHDHRFHNHNRNTTIATAQEQEDLGIYLHEGGGMLIIDDDANPGLRGGENNDLIHNYNSSLNTTTNINTDSVPRSNPHWTARNRFANAHTSQDDTFPTLAVAAAASNTDDDNNNNNDENEEGLWNPRNILTRHSHAARVRADNFPTLSPSNNANTDTSPSATKQQQQTKKPFDTASRSKPISNSLAKIGNMVQKVSAKQMEKQRRAREVALQRQGELAGNTDTTTFSRRNSGWARPTNDTSATKGSAPIQQLLPVKYPDALIIQARELMPELLKLERKWTTFLQDDTAASCPLKAMERPARKFTHEYSDYWNLHTESFDPAPRRYIHCVKMDDTAAPIPLLSNAVRTWSGPSSTIIESDPSNLLSRSMAAMALGGDEQTAGQVTMSSVPPPPRGALHLPEGRVPLKLEPRTLPHNITAPPGAMFDMMVDTSAAAIDINDTVHSQYNNSEQKVDAPILSMNASKGPSLLPQEPAARFAPLLAERDERTRLVLKPRTKPLELPPFQPTRMTELKASMQADRKATEERNSRQAEKKKTILESAFASDDEADASVGGSGDDSDWDVGEAEYDGSSEEDES